MAIVVAGLITSATEATAQLDLSRALTTLLGANKDKNTPEQDVKSP